jgi:hypothetical protein
MKVIEEDEQQKQQPTPTIETLEQKIDELVNTVDELHTLHYLYESRTKTIIKQIGEARQLALDLNVDEIQLRKMISQSFAKAGVSESWLRKLLPDSLKFTKHTRKDYLKRQQQQDQQPLIQPQQQHQELADLPTSKQPVLEQQQLQQQQPSDKKATKITTFDNKLTEMPQQTEEEEEEEEEKLKQRIEELQRENKYLREVTATKGQQPQQEKQHEETFAALGQLQLGDFRMRIKVTVNVKTKSIELMELAW